STAFPLTTPEWSAWSATMRPPRLQGKWALSGRQLGKGPIFGQVVISAAGDPDRSEFTTETTFTYARTGQTGKRTGRAIVYTGFQWRGKSDDGSASGGTADSWREVLFVDRDWRRANGRWFTGAYDEFGIDVNIERVGSDPIVLGVANPMVRIGVPGQEIRIFGANLPASVQPTDLNLGPGIVVDRFVRTTPEQLTVSISATNTASP